MLLTANTICLLSSMQHVTQAELAAWLATKLFKLFLVHKFCYSVCPVWLSMQAGIGMVNSLASKYTVE